MLFLRNSKMFGPLWSHNKCHGTQTQDEFLLANRRTAFLSNIRSCTGTNQFCGLNDK